MSKPLRNEAVEFNTKEAFRCLRHWQIFTKTLWIMFFATALVLIVCFSL